jgi:GNAT superfamily N-acetyltransferase
VWEGDNSAICALQAFGPTGYYEIMPRGKASRMLDEYELRQVVSPADWEAYHRIRRTVLFEGRGRFDYNENVPDERSPNNQSLLLLYRGKYIGTVRLDYVAPDLGIIRLFAIDRPFQRAGHGQNFLSLLENHATSHGIKNLEVNAAREAVSYWQQQGFRMIDEAREFPLLGREVVGPL